MYFPYTYTHSHSIYIFSASSPISKFPSGQTWTWNEMFHAFDIEKQLKIPPAQSGN